jgi:predicted amidohydrolase
MEKFTVAAVQMNAMKGDLEGNLAIHEKYTVEAAQNGARLIMFPELSVTAHFGDPAATELAERSDRGHIHDTMLSLARDNDIIISYGLCEYANSTYYNAQALMGPDGLIGVQHKVHASGDEYFYFRMGRKFHVFDLGFCTIGTLICYDVTFFEAWRALALMGADVLLLPHAARSARGSELPTEQQEEVVRKMLDDTKSNSVYTSANSAYAIFANQFGYNGHSTHGGGVYVLDPSGEQIARGEPVLENQMILTEIDPAVTMKARSDRSVLKQRRPELYGILTEMI